MQANKEGNPESEVHWSGFHIRKRQGASVRFWGDPDQGREEPDVQARGQRKRKAKRHVLERLRPQRVGINMAMDYKRNQEAWCHQPEGYYTQDEVAARVDR